MGCVNTPGCSTSSWMLTLRCLSCPCSPRALSRLGTPPRAWRMSAAGPTSSRSQTQAMTNTMITLSSSHGRTLGLRGCKVSLTPDGFGEAGPGSLGPSQGRVSGWGPCQSPLALKNHQGLCYFPEEAKSSGEIVKIRRLVKIRWLKWAESGAGSPGTR